MSTVESYFRGFYSEYIFLILAGDNAALTGDSDKCSSKIWGELFRLFDGGGGGGRWSALGNISDTFEYLIYSFKKIL